MFMCGRPDPATELFEEEPVVPVLGLMGCKNLTDRLNDSLRFQMYYQSHARRVWNGWATDHGWRVNHG
jgi:hypothetical protein